MPCKRMFVCTGYFVCTYVWLCLNTCALFNSLTWWNRITKLWFNFMRWFCFMMYLYSVVKVHRWPNPAGPRFLLGFPIGYNWTCHAMLMHCLFLSVHSRLADNRTNWCDWTWASNKCLRGLCAWQINIRLMSMVLLHKHLSVRSGISIGVQIDSFFSVDDEVNTWSKIESVWGWSRIDLFVWVLFLAWFRCSFHSLVEVRLCCVDSGLHNKSFAILCFYLFQTLCQERWLLDHRFSIL